MEEKKDNIFEMLDKTNVVEVDAINEMKTSFIAYAMAVNVSRAIPDVRDGLKSRWNMTVMNRIKTASSSWIWQAA